MKRIKELRALVRASLASMDETPATPITIDGSELVDALWHKVERNPPTGRRDIIPGLKDTHGNTIEEDEGLGLTSTLRSIADYKLSGGRILVRYHGESWQDVSGEYEYLRSLMPPDTRLSAVKGAINRIAKG